MRIQKHFKNPMKKSERKSSTMRSRARKMARKRVVCSSKRRRICSKSCPKSKEVISEKLAALKSLIPGNNVRNGSNGIVKVEQLFQETADYIIVLKTQAVLLQKLIEFYDHGDEGSNNEMQHQIVQQHQS
ncbi:hypothetical protein Gogos_001850 [Gossypium gossypioides]|uniref:BHLH domain-containing protein n=1 Tax=Gossypium gossypioides TaxID=34282 RepID=A0A7J9CPK1_GOSGO|nr:hypothetical protein [Gossypium gossypioides]